MKTLGLVLAMLLVISASALADTATLDVYQGWNYIGCPLVPMNLSNDPEVDPENDFTEPYFAFDEVAFDLETGKLLRFDAVNAANLVYLGDEAFGKLLLGDGYMLNCSIPGKTTITYTGVPNGVPDAGGNKTDMWISLPGKQGDSNVPYGGGWHLISTPYADDVPAYTFDQFENIIWNINFTDGTQVLDWMAAADAGWVADTMYGLTGGVQNLCTYNSETEYIMKAGKGYFLETKKDNIAMIITAQP